MKFKSNFINEVVRRLKENIDVIQSSFELANIDLVKTKLYNIEPLEYHLSVLLEDDPYKFINNIVYIVINRQNVRVSRTNIACDLLLELINMVLDEFSIERIGRIGE